MSKVELIVPEHEIVDTTKVLATSAVFHLVPDGYVGMSNIGRPTGEWQEKAITFTALERRVLTVMNELGIDEGPLPSETPLLIDPKVAEMDVARLEYEAEGPVRELEEAQRKLPQLQQFVNQLEPIADLDIDVETLRNLRYTFVILGSIPIANIERLQASLEHIPFVLVTLRYDRPLATVMLFGTQRDAEILSRAARSAYLIPLQPPENYPGKPAEAIAAIHAGIERTRQRIVRYEAQIAHLHEMRISHLRSLLWSMRASRMVAETIAGYDRLERTYLLAGWVPTSQVPSLKRQIAEVSDEVLIEVSAPQKEDAGRIPVVLDNPPLLRAFQGLVTTYGQPSYGELDPTFVMTLTFPLIFGIMFGDVGHGLLLTLAGLLLASRRVRALQSIAAIGAVITLCGISAIFFGFLYGSLFGFEGVLKPLWTQPLNNTMDVLLTTVIIGMGLLTLGMIYNIVNAVLASRWGFALFDRNSLAGILFYWSLIGLAASAFGVKLPISPTPFLIVAVIAGITLTFSEALESLLEEHRFSVKGSVSTYLIQAIFEFFEVIIGLLSNTLSYVRMGAFAVAHGALCLVVLIIGELISPQHGAGYWIVVVFGNLFVIGFEGMIVGIQTLRLEYYEFFSKFFSGSGIRYRPLMLIKKGEE